MNQKHWKNLLLVIPVIILAMVLFFVDYTMQYLKDTVCTYIYLTNVESVKRYSQEISASLDAGFDSDSYKDLYTRTILIYHRSLGERDSIVTFSVDENDVIYHSNPYNEEYLASFLENTQNQNAIRLAAASHDNGELLLYSEKFSETFFYQVFSDGVSNYTLFLCIDRIKIETELKANQIILPICFVGLLLLFLVEYTIWIKMTHVPVT